MDDNHNCYDNTEFRTDRTEIDSAGTVVITGICSVCGQGVGARFALQDTWTDE